VAVDTCDLPPLGGSSSLRPVENYSPSAPLRAPERSSARCLTGARRRCRATPRPLAVQRLAGQLVADAHGLGHGHIGAICDAITSASIDPAVWSAQAICNALNADMRATGWSWPDTIHHPGAFLASRLRRLPRRVVDQPLSGGCAAARLDKPHSAQSAAPPRYVPGPPLVLTDAQRERIDATKAVMRQHFVNRARRKTASAAADTAWPRRRKPERQPACEPTVCAACGGPDPIRRPYLPTRRAHICEQCWAAFMRPAQPEAEVTVTCDPIHPAVGGCGCVVCGSMRAAARPQLPLKSMVCDRCCSVTAPPELQADNSVDGPAQVVSA